MTAQTFTLPIEATTIVGVKRCGVEKADHRHCSLLRARRERPRGCRAAEQRDEHAASYSDHF
jgi:hypothetical protein